MKEDLNKIKNAFPSYLAQHIENLYQSKKLLIPSVNTLKLFTVVLNSETLLIPAQINLIEEEFNISIEKDILDCYLTRHFDPLVREKHFRNIVKLKHEWVIPYIFIILGHSRIETLNILYDELKHFDPKAYKNFIQNNPRFYALIKGRVGSYYGRQYPCYIPREKSWRRRNYVGFKILKLFNNFLM